MNVNMNMCMHVYMCTCVNECVYTYIYIEREREAHAAQKTTQTPGSYVLVVRPKARGIPETLGSSFGVCNGLCHGASFRISKK